MIVGWHVEQSGFHYRSCLAQVFGVRISSLAVLAHAVLAFPYVLELVSESLSRTASGNRDYRRLFSLWVRIGAPGAIAALPRSRQMC